MGKSKGRVLGEVVKMELFKKIMMMRKCGNRMLQFQGEEAEGH